MLEKKQL